MAQEPEGPEAPGAEDADAHAPTWLRAWHSATRPHPAVRVVHAQRRARLAAGLLLVLMPLALLFVAVYDLPALFTAPEPLDGLSLVVLVAFVAAYFLVRGRHPDRGVLLAITVPLGVVWSGYFADAENGTETLYFALLPILLGGLLLDLRMATAVATANILTLSLAPLLVELAGAPIDPQELLEPFLFFLATSPVVLAGAGFLERSTREAEAANARLQEADRMRLEVLNTVAHDLASPLTPLRIQLNLLRRRGEESHAVDVMERNVALLARLVGDVKDLANLEVGALRLESVPLDLTQVVTSSVEDLRGRAEARGLEVRVQGEQELPVTGDPDRLTQVCQNLLTNAIKFTPPGGSITVRLAKDQGSGVVTVQDTGRGLSADEIPRLFQPFSQVHHRKEVEEKGTGLGLYIAKGIVEGHGGEVFVRSDGHGEGSTFGFTVPTRPT